MRAIPIQPSAAYARSATCDLCGWPMPVPQHCIEAGVILGLMTCSACVEDALAARQLETA